MALTNSRSSFSILPSHQNPLLSSLTLSPHFQIHRKRLSIVSHRRTRRRPRRKLAGRKDMSVAITMPTPSHRREKSQDSVLDSTNSAGEGEMLTADVEGEMSSTSKTAMRKSKYLISRICFGVDLSPDNIAVAMVYFVQGVLGLARLAVSFYLKDDLHLEPAETAVISGFSALPWLIKPLYGFISDSVPLFGYRRRSYLVLSGLLGALSWSLMSTFVDSKYSAAFCILLGSLSVAFSDVVVDSMVVERARGESQSEVRGEQKYKTFFCHWWCLRHARLVC